MSCQKCTTTPEFSAGEKKIVIFASHEYMLKKFYDLFNEKFTINDNIDHLILNYNFENFIRIVSTSKDFSQIELDNITIMPIEIDSPITLSAYKKAKSLIYWINLYYSKDLKWILDNESIITYFQPIIDAHTKEIVGYECLSRGLKEDGTIMPPNLMFEAARKTEMLFNLDRQCRISAIKHAKLKNIDKMLFINFAPTSIYNPEFCLRDTVKTAQELNIDPQKITFEVVETEKVDNINHLKNIFDYYREMGFKVGLDDVGSGYSSLKMIAELKPDIIKIDMELVRDIHKDTTKKAIVSSIIALTKDLGAKSLAEGTETKEEAETLLSLGVDMLQGYFFGKPSPEPAKSLL